MGIGCRCVLIRGWDVGGGELCDSGAGLVVLGGVVGCIIRQRELVPGVIIGQCSVVVLFIQKIGIYASIDRCKRSTSRKTSSGNKSALEAR